MGKREIGELDISELVSALLISEVAAIPIDDPDLPLLNAIIPIIFILSLEILLSYGKTKFNVLKKIMEGSPVYLVYKGEIRQVALGENRLTVNELLSEMRVQGIGDISEVEYAMLEQSGKISFIQKKTAVMAHSVIIDGEINEEEIRAAHITNEEVNAQLIKGGISQGDVFLMTVNDEKDTNIILREKT
ncbi:MAG: DUF421 domain-containing protein [Clostridia bacterium]|nr:DUF421 domain-containing protein [Clostridia bacterium]